MSATRAALLSAGRAKLSQFREEKRLSEKADKRKVSFALPDDSVASTARNTLGVAYDKTPIRAPGTPTMGIFDDAVVVRG